MPSPILIGMRYLSRPGSSTGATTQPETRQSSVSMTDGQGIRGANYGSQWLPTPPDSPRPRGANLQGETLARLPQTGRDTRFVPGGQGVAGSNPAVPTSWQGPLIRVLRLGQRAFCHTGVRAHGSLDDPQLGTIWGPADAEMGGAEARVMPDHNGVGPRPTLADWGSGR
jgi:hypothetical protein